MASNTFTLDGRNNRLTTNFGIWSTGFARVLYNGTDITGHPDLSFEGIETGSVSVTVVLGGALNQAGAVVQVIRADYVTPGLEVESLVSDIGKIPGGGVNPVKLKQEFVHLLQLISGVTGGVDPSEFDLAAVRARLNVLAALLFDAPTLNSFGDWNGTGAIPDTLEGVEARTGVLESGLAQEVQDRIDGDTVLQVQIASGVGLPTPLPASDTNDGDLPPVPDNNYFLGTDDSGFVEWRSIEKLLGVALMAPQGTRLIFQQDTAPVGWTKVTDADYNNAMLIVSTSSFVVGSSDTGGSLNAQSHNHTGPSHTHSASSQNIQFVDTTPATTFGWISDTSPGAGWTSGLFVRSVGGNPPRVPAHATDGGTTGSAGTGNTSTFSPKYFLSIIAEKD